MCKHAILLLLLLLFLLYNTGNTNSIDDRYSEGNKDGLC